MFSNNIIYNLKGKIKFDTKGEIELPITAVKYLGIYKCPLRIVSVDNFSFFEGTLIVGEPGRYLVEYE